MIVKELTKEEMYNPIILEITLETEEEAQAFYAIFNKTKNSNLIGEKFAMKICDILSDFYLSNNKDVIANGITYDKFYNDNK